MITFPSGSYGIMFVFRDSDVQDVDGLEVEDEAIVFFLALCPCGSLQSNALSKAQER